MVLLGEYMPNWLPDDPNKKAAARQGLLSLGAAMLNGRGNLGEVLGQGLLAGSQGYHGALEQQQQAGLHKAQQRRWEMENQQTQAALDQDRAISAGLFDFNRSQATGGTSSPGPGPRQSVPSLSAIPQTTKGPDTGRPLSMIPQSSTAPILPLSALPQAGAPAPAADQTSEYETVAARARYLNANFPGSKQAVAALEAAKQFRPEVREVVEMQVGGKPVMVQLFKDGRPPQILENFDPKREKLVFADNGGTYNGRDAYTGEIKSTSKNTVSPDARLSAETQRRGQNMADKRARQEIAAGGKPPPGYRWTPDGTLAAIPGGPGDKLPEAQQKQVVGVNNLSNAIREYRAELANFGRLDALSPDGRARMGTKYNNMMLQAKEAYNLGVLNGPDLEILTSVITDPRSMKGVLTSKNALDTQASELDRIMQDVGAVSGSARQPQNGGKPIKSVKELPQKSSPASHPADISNLLNKYGAK